MSAIGVFLEFKNCNISSVYFFKCLEVKAPESGSLCPAKELGRSESLSNFPEIDVIGIAA